ncbi:hypothetical protein WAF17_12095 [Bernardetia sp. ABR2-2B]|uniref:hypothetical protein n=1 Tax=Bernardetia sp. ABR2-2B TaxID=3127472 RepID=UPI0030CB7E23
MILINELIDFYSHKYRNQQMRRIETVLKKRGIDKYVIYRCMNVFDEFVYAISASRYQLEITESKIIFEFLGSEFQNPILLDFTKQLEFHSNNIYKLSNTEKGICFQPTFEDYLTKEERKKIKKNIKKIKIQKRSRENIFFMGDCLCAGECVVRCSTKAIFSRLVVKKHTRFYLSFTKNNIPTLKIELSTL